MSADRWSLCPVCFKYDQEQKRLRIEAVNAAYGKATASTYLNLLKEAEKQNSEALEETLREDFLVGLAGIERWTQLDCVLFSKMYRMSV